MIAYISVLYILAVALAVSPCWLCAVAALPWWVYAVGASGAVGAVRQACVGGMGVWGGCGLSQAKVAKGSCFSMTLACLSLQPTPAPRP